MTNSSRNLFIRNFVIVFTIAIMLIAAKCSVIDTAYAADNVLTINNSRALPGDTLEISFSGTSTVPDTYLWYVGDELVQEGGKTFDVTSSDLENMISVEAVLEDEVIASDSIFCSKLPVLYIDTENNKAIESKDIYIPATMKIQGNKEYTSVQYDGNIEIKGRGNSTWTRFAKKPYKIKLDKSTDLFGMGKNKHWTLIANYIDESLMRNPLSSDIAKELGSEGFDYEWTDVILNGEYVGNYQLYEHARIDENRVNIYDWEGAAEDIAKAIAKKNGLSKDEQKAIENMAVEDLSWVTTRSLTYKGVDYNIDDLGLSIESSFTGGYFLELDNSFDELSKFRTSRNIPIMLKSPEYTNSNGVMFTYIENYIQDFEDAIYSDDKTTERSNEVEGNKVSYAQLADMDSIVSYWLACESLECELGYKSMYMYKDTNEKLRFGPVWDFDFSSGSVAPFGTRSNKKWLGKESQWFSDLIKDPYFAEKARALYESKQEYLHNITAEGGTLDQWNEYIRESGLANSERWSYSRGYDNDYNELKSWVSERFNWMDKQFATQNSTLKSLGIELSDSISMNVLTNTDLTKNGRNYIADVDKFESMTVNVSTTDGQNKLNYYINGCYIGYRDVKAGKANLYIEKAELTEGVDKKNVITVRTVDGNNKVVSTQYITFELSSNRGNYVNVKFIDDGQEYSKIVRKGTTVYLPETSTSNKNLLFVGWKDSDTDEVYASGKRIPVTADMELNAVWDECSGGRIEHEFVKTSDGYVCKVCHKTKDDSDEYIDIAGMQITQSNRYNNTYTGKEIKPQIIVYNGQVQLTENVHYKVTYKNNIEVGYATATVTGIKAAGYNGSADISFRINPQPETYRIDGPTRYDTAIAVADKIKKETSAKNFKSIIVTSGENYPDALAGGYLSKIKNAPILLVNAQSESKVKSYIDSNLKSDGTVYILGGNLAVSDKFEETLSKTGYVVKRLGGATRYDTNISILKEAGVNKEELLVCTGKNFADSLSAAAVGRPILIVDSSLTKSQKTYLGTLNPSAVTVLGGTLAVNEKVVNEIKREVKNSPSFDRLSGSTRYATSVAIAKKYIGESPSTVVLTTGTNFPDGLAGGLFAITKKAPLLLVAENNYSDAENYCKQNSSVKFSYALGGTKIVSEKVRKAMIAK